MTIYLSDILFSAIAAALLTIIIETVRLAHSYVGLPKLSPEYNHQKFMYCITCGDYTFIGYSDTEYTPAEMIRYAINKLNLTGEIIITLSEEKPRD